MLSWSMPEMEKTHRPVRLVADQVPFGALGRITGAFRKRGLMSGGDGGGDGSSSSSASGPAPGAPRSTYLVRLEYMQTNPAGEPVEESSTSAVTGSTTASPAAKMKFEDLLPPSKRAHEASKRLAEKDASAVPKDKTLLGTIFFFESGCIVASEKWPGPPFLRTTNEPCVPRACLPKFWQALSRKDIEKRTGGLETDEYAHFELDEVNAAIAKQKKAQSVAEGTDQITTVDTAGGGMGVSASGSGRVMFDSCGNSIEIGTPAVPLDPFFHTAKMTAVWVAENRGQYRNSAVGRGRNHAEHNPSSEAAIVQEEAEKEMPKFKFSSMKKKDWAGPIDARPNLLFEYHRHTILTRIEAAGPQGEQGGENGAQGAGGAVVLNSGNPGDDVEEVNNRNETDEALERSRQRRWARKKKAMGDFA
ncbi:unnamed protein product [Amoebophrya sp. A25]|nr:unnamed protein product [Amoebophrya sp. A25]|eukprot:GSA25T00007217001.1